MISSAVLQAIEQQIRALKGLGRTVSLDPYPAGNDCLINFPTGPERPARGPDEIHPAGMGLAMTQWEDRMKQ